MITAAEEACKAGSVEDARQALLATALEADPTLDEVGLRRYLDDHELVRQ